MRIERLETFPLLYKLARPYGDANGYKKYRSCFLIKITTSSGLTGWGECVDWLPTLEIGFQQRIIPFLLGKQATDRNQLVSTVSKWHRRSAAGVSMALTAILAERAALPLADLWGGSRWQEVPVYASFQSYTPEPDWPHVSRKMAEKAVAEGFTQLKVKIGGRSLAEDQQHIEQLQQTFAGQVQLALDANQSYDFATTKSWRSLLVAWSNWMWLEEPMPLDQREDYQRLRTDWPIPIAGGENLTSMRDFVALIQQGSLDIFQPDTMHCEQIDTYREIVQFSRQAGLRVSPHAYDGALSRMYAAIAQACLASWSKMEPAELEPVEWDVMENPFSRLLSVQPRNGRLAVPQGIGLGVELDMELIESLRWDGQLYL